MASGPTRKNMCADHLIKYPFDHPAMCPKVVGVRLTGGTSGGDALATARGSVPLLKSVYYLRNLTGQRPTIVKALHSVSGFKIRKGEDLHTLVTVRERARKRQLYEYILLVTSVSQAVAGARPPKAGQTLNLSPSPTSGPCPLYFGLSAPKGSIKAGEARGVKSGHNVQLLVAVRGARPG